MGPSLRHYTPDQVVEAAAALRLRLGSGLNSPPEVERLLTLRADDGSAWAHGLRSNGWYAHSSGAWTPRQPAPASFEGLAGLASLLRPGSPPLREGEVAALPNETLEPLSASLALLDWLHAGYESGRLSTSEMATFLDELVLLDSQGSLWAPGFQTRRWYQFVQSHWRLAKTPPGAGAGLQGRAPPPEAAAQALGRLEDASPRFPEPITLPWTPPPGYPERLACAHCGNPLLTGSETCPVCRLPAPLAPQHPDEAGAAAAFGPTTWSLSIVEGVARGRTFTVRGGEGIGRGPGNEIIVEDAKASAQHARIERVGNVLRVIDLGSTNGTALNGVTVTQPTSLKEGDRIRVGATVLEVRGPEPCSHCGAPITPGDSFCGECGTPGANVAAPAPGTSPAAAGLAIAPAPSPAYRGQPRSRRFTWSGVILGCLLVFGLLAGTALCLFAIFFLGQS